MKLRHLLPFLAASTLAFAAPAPTTNFDGWANDVAAEIMRANPSMATMQQYFTGDEQDLLDRKLTPITKEARAARIAQAQRAQSVLKQFNVAKLSFEERISASIIDWQLETTIRADEFSDHSYIFEQFGGLQVRLVNFLSQTHPVRNPRDIENYLARLKLVAAQMDEGVTQARERATRGFTPPKFILESTIAQFDRFLADAAAKNVLVASLDERAAKIAGLLPEQRAEAVTAAEKIVGAEIIPAFRRAQDLLKQQLATARDGAGLVWLPNGQAAYAAALRRFTTTEMTPDEVHALGLKEVARIEATMDGLLKKKGYADGSIKDRMAKLENDLQPAAEPDPRAGLIKRYEEILADALVKSADAFDARPKAPCVVKREPPFTEKSAAAHYTGPSRDGTRPGIFWAPLPGPYEMTGMRTLVYHEAIPGHHFQIALQRETESLPRFRRDGIFSGGSAYSEGWALYAEQLAVELGWYGDDIVGQLGQLDDELFRARRLVVDTGIHAKGWTRQQAIDYGIKVSEVERYVVNAGQACAYKIGQLKILALRAKAKDALGAKFDLKKFHNVVLQSGNMPLAVLEQVIDDYVAAAK
ncbi:DUF885 domain-containing protein [Oleiharenicola lentus]|uniref:DUF885 domain-containing protein n=1 Tax=Oleiharenicola lentus TaxID=2508720 RepID=UPI003F67DC6A